jgi:hypothetical protein
MGRIYVPPTEPADPEDSEAAVTAEPAGQGRIYLPSSEPVAEKPAAADDEPADGHDDDKGDDDSLGKDSETVTVTEPAQAKPAPPPAKKATSSRGKTS